MLGHAELIASETQASEAFADWEPEEVLLAMVVAELSTIRETVLATRADMTVLQARLLPMLDNPAARWMARRKGNQTNG